ncbi:unnamed protein product [Rangifer tarandus platyrhynchus]|uniref:Uncharacterized protein n=2 Tax=Rangifer tarandus platyrhynchus TaxID=3082113 RepID=A0AC59ZA72_RANTA|nr:unnamed protein product [Rangifer tarandus platyrhynchus]
MALSPPVGVSETLKEEGVLIFLSAQLQAVLHLSLRHCHQGVADHWPRRSATQTAEMYHTAPYALQLRCPHWGGGGATHFFLQGSGRGGWPLPGPAHDMKRKEMPSSYC